MGTHMHIATTNHPGVRTAFGFGIRTFCGRVLRVPADGAHPGAPVCPTCERKAGWLTRDPRKHRR